jgi:superfamily I DNA/RNA helicase
VEHFVDMPGRVRVLEKSWRVPVEVQGIAEEVIGRVRHRRPKAWMPREGEGSILRPMQLEEVDLWSDDVLILARNGYSLRDAEPLLQQEGVLYEVQGRSSVRRGTLDAIRLWERLRKGERITAQDAIKVYDAMSTGAGVKRGFKKLPGVAPESEVDMAWLRENGGLLRDEIWHVALDRIEPKETAYILKALRKGEKISSEPRVRMSTIHGSKGGEATHVVLITDMAARTHREFEQNPEDEARVWYVGATRAKQKLSIVAPSGKLHYRL